ncbi:MAG: amidohydrolase [Gemmatimonadetes bacterium]|nr:amidohydrolase [Gemmatimonadota bacterium]
MLVVASTSFLGCATDEVQELADVVLTNGKVVTVDDALPEAQAIAIRGDRIIAVGTNEEITALVGELTSTIDLAGRLALPGFIEGHGHYTSLGRSKTILDLTQVESWDEIVVMVADAVQSAFPDQWIEGRGWHQEKWNEVPPGSVEGVPTHTTLSAVSNNNPVVLGHASGHAAFVNAYALELAGINNQTPDPPGGTIVRDADGSATGLLRENADGLVYRVVEKEKAQLSEAEKWNEFSHQVELAGEEALSKGVTTFHDAGASFATIDGFKQLADEGRLPVRLYVMVRSESNVSMDDALPSYRMIGYGGNHLTVRSIKRQIDGALGSHGAWLLEPYEDMPSSTGLWVEEPDDIETTAQLAAKHGFQLNTHAIGDRANREVLDIYERTFPEGAGGQMRWRIEHAQHVHPDDVRRFADLGVIASMQGVHATSDAPWVYARLGVKRAESGAYLWRSLIEAGVMVTNGTDTPVEDVSPISSLYSSVVRQDRDGNEFFPGQRMTRLEALQSYTINNAYAAFEEDIKGSITVGKLADITVLDRDIMTVPEAEIARAQVDMTIVGGEIRFERGSR